MFSRRDISSLACFSRSGFRSSLSRDLSSIFGARIKCNLSTFRVAFPDSISQISQRLQKTWVNLSIMATGNPRSIRAMIMLIRAAPCNSRAVRLAHCMNLILACVDRRRRNVAVEARSVIPVRPMCRTLSRPRLAGNEGLITTFEPGLFSLVMVPVAIIKYGPPFPDTSHNITAVLSMQIHDCAI